MSAVKPPFPGWQRIPQSCGCHDLWEGPGIELLVRTGCTLNIRRCGNDWIIEGTTIQPTDNHHPKELRP